MSKAPGTPEKKDECSCVIFSLSCDIVHTTTDHKFLFSFVTTPNQVRHVTYQNC